MFIGFFVSATLKLWALKLGAFSKKLPALMKVGAGMFL